MPDGTWIKLQRIADFLEAERSVPLVGENPEVGFSEPLLSGRVTCLEIGLEATHRIDKNSPH